MSLVSKWNGKTRELHQIGSCFQLKLNRKYREQYSEAISQVINFYGTDWKLNKMED